MMGGEPIFLPFPLGLAAPACSKARQLLNPTSSKERTIMNMVLEDLGHTVGSGTSAYGLPFELNQSEIAIHLPRKGGIIYNKE